MSSMRLLDALLLLLLVLLQVSANEELDPLFRVEGSVIELGYCFGVDYIVVYRSGPEEDQLLGNSSSHSPSLTPPADLKGRIRINSDQHLLGLQISDLTQMDSGLYRRECWQDGKQVSQQAQQLYVCDEEVESTEILESEGGGGTDLLCNSTFMRQEGVSVSWYREKHPAYKPNLFLDSSMSMNILLEELQGVVEVREGGALLQLDPSVLKNNHHFYCMVNRGDHCLSFQNMFLPDNSESIDAFATHGERVELKCPSEGLGQQWETPLGKLDKNSVKNSNMFISFGDQSKDFSLVIPVASDDHSGDYSCISSTVEVQYSLVLCPGKESQEVVYNEGTNASIRCDVGEQSFKRVQWYRRDPNGYHRLIHDTDHHMMDAPADLIGRVTLSENGSLLSISHLERRDDGIYWCVVFRESVFNEADEYTDDDYKDDEDDEDPTEEVPSDEHFWLNSCIFKQETSLALNTSCASGTRGCERSPTVEPAAPSDLTVYVAVGAVLVGLLVIGIIAFVIKRRRQASPKPGVDNELKKRDPKLKEEPGCTDSLTHNEDNGP